MRSRCEWPKNISYPQYGGNGISVCGGWHTFENFRDDMYESYLKHVELFGEKNTQIDRINGLLGYSQSNCRWATLKEQARNKRNLHKITYKGVTHCISEWAELFGLTTNCLKQRIRRGWSFERATNTLI